MRARSSPAVAVIVTLGIIQFIGFWVLYTITPSPNMIHHIIAISDLGLWVMFVVVLPRYLEEPEPDIPERIADLIQKSWNEGLDPGQREEIRVWASNEKNEIEYQDVIRRDLDE